MKKSSQILVLVCSLLLLGAYIFPLWKIALEAPQYPEGLEMKIWINNITGDVQKINGLNHYIGMKHIIVEEFKEFKILPYVIAFLIGFGLITYWKKSRTLLFSWIVLLLIFGTVGAIDFYRWEYDYGHNLDPMAAIKVPGMAYQPPLLGYKQLLNFLAASFPDTGGWMVISSIILAVSVGFLELKEFKKLKASPLLLLSLLFFTSCSTKGPAPINYGTDECAHCKMTIMDNRFGAVLLTKNGKSFKFDSAECLIDYANDNPEHSDSYFITDYTDLSVANAKEAVFVHSNSIQSPMGGNIAAFSNKAAASKVQTQQAGVILNWDEARSIRKHDHH